MATKVHIENVSRGWREILNSAPVRALVDEAGRQIAQRAGEGFEYFPAFLNYGGGRVGGYVHATTPEAMLAQAEDKALERAVHV